jgi:hypothetical protein
VSTVPKMEPCRCPVFFLNMGIYIMGIPFWEFPDRATFLEGTQYYCSPGLTDESIFLDT